MKTTILTAALFIVITAASAMTVNDTISLTTPVAVQEFKANIIQPSMHILNFRIANPAADKVVMKIYNEKKVKVFHRSTKKIKELSIRCNMQNCSPGLYTCVIERNGKEELRKKFSVN